MIFYNNRSMEIRKSLKISIVKLAEEMGISRNTLGAWEKGKIIPSEKKVRILAEHLGINISEISDLRENKPTSEILTYKGVVKFVSSKESLSENIFRKLSDYVNDISLKISSYNQIVNAFTQSSRLIFYIKDINLRYIAVSDYFFKNLTKLKKKDFLEEKDEFELFSQFEASFNNKEDEKIIKTGIPVQDANRYVPGMKKKKIAYLSKEPIYDSENKICGMIALYIDINEQEKDEIARSQLQSVLNNNDVCINVGSGVKFEHNGGIHLAKRLLRVGGARYEYLGYQFLNQIDKDYPLNEYIEFIGQVPNDKKQKILERINGPYPIVRRNKYRSSESLKEYDVIEFHYYDEKKDVLTSIYIKLNSVSAAELSSNCDFEYEKKKIAQKLKAKGVSKDIIDYCLS